LKLGPFNLSQLIMEAKGSPPFFSKIKKLLPAKPVEVISPRSRIAEVSRPDLHQGWKSIRAAQQDDFQRDEHLFDIARHDGAEIHFISVEEDLPHSDPREGPERQG